MASPGRAESPPRKALIIVENNSVPFDRRVWREALALQEAGWHVSVVCPKSPEDDRLVYADSPAGDYEVLEGIHIYRFPMQFAEHGVVAFLREYATAFLASVRLSRRVLREQGFDVLQVCNPPDIFFPLGAYYRLRGKGFIFDHHDLFPESVAYRYKGASGRLMYWLGSIFERLTFRAANVVIATNESYRQVAIERGHVEPDRVFVVRNGPELAFIRDIVPDPSLKNGRPYLACFLGVMGVEDGLEPMMEAIRCIVHDLGRPDIQFVLMGDGRQRHYALERVDAWNLKAQVLLPGRVPDEDVQRYLSTADVCLSPDPYTPLNDLSTMNKIIEYMAFGKPIVSFDLKEARVSADEAAVYVACGDERAFAEAIVDLLDDPERRVRMGQLGRQRVLTKLAWDHQTPYLCAAYETSLGLAGPEQPDTE
jgi:glycosyltransferase involved in cell wall biosynthesis